MYLIFILSILFLILKFSKKNFYKNFTEPRKNLKLVTWLIVINSKRLEIGAWVKNGLISV